MTGRQPWRIAALGLAVAALLALGPAGTARAHGDHSDEAPPPSAGPLAPRIAAHSETYELVGVAQDKTLTFYLDRFRDDSPVTGAKLEVGTPDGKSAIAAATGQGAYRLMADWVATPGRHDLVFTITDGSDADLLGGTLDIPRPEAAAPPPSGAFALLTAHGPVDSGLAFLLGIAVTLAIMYFFTSRGARSEATARPPASMATAAPVMDGQQKVRLAVVLALIGAALLFIGHRVLAHDEGHEEAAASPTSAGASSSPRRLLDGSVFLPKASQRILHVRTEVTKKAEVASSMRLVGQVVADPGSSGVVHATVQGRLAPIDGKWPQIGQVVQADQVLAEVIPVVNPIDRGIILQQVAQIDHDIDGAQQKLNALDKDPKATARARDDARAELGNLARRREAIGNVIRDRDHLRTLLRAPSNGVISASYAAAGQIVDVQTKLFEVVDPKRLWVEGYAYDINGIGDVVDADAVAASGHNYHLKFINRGPQLEKQTIPLFFQIEYPDANLSVGSLVTVLVRTAQSRTGLIVPRSAVVQDPSGQTIVWKHDHAEAFVATPVRTEPVDGENVLVAAGLEPDARIVVDGADLLTEIR